MTFEEAKARIQGLRGVPIPLSVAVRSLNDSDKYRDQQHLADPVSAAAWLGSVGPRVQHPPPTVTYAYQRRIAANALAFLPECERSTDPILQQLWRHAAWVGFCAEAIAERRELADPLIYRLAGLVHDLGKVVLCALDGQAYRAARENALLRGEAVIEVEAREFGVSHPLAGKWLAEKWGLPSSYIEVIWLHHVPLRALKGTSSDTDILAVVRLANALSHLTSNTDEKAMRAFVAPELLERLQLTLPDCGALRTKVNALMTQVDWRCTAEELQSALMGFMEREAPAPEVIIGEQDRITRDTLEWYRILRSAVSLNDLMERVARHGRTAYVAHRCVFQIQYPDGAISSAVSDENETRLVQREKVATVSPAATTEHRGIRLEAGKDYDVRFLLEEPLHMPRDEVVDAVSEALRLWLRVTRAEEHAEVLGEAVTYGQPRPRPTVRQEDAAQIPPAPAHETPKSGRFKDVQPWDHGESFRKEDIRLEPAPVNRFVQKVVSRFATQMRELGIEVVEQYAPGLPLAPLDQQAMDNALTHMMAYVEALMAARGGIVTVETAAAGGNRIEIRFTESGMALPREGVASVWDEMADSTDMEGPFAYLEEVVRNHDGAIRTGAGKDGDRSLVISLPAASQTEPAVAETAQPSPPPEASPKPPDTGGASPGPERPAPTESKATTGKRTVLLVDDDEDLVEVLRETLKIGGYEVRTAVKAEDVRTEVAWHDIDLVLIDLHVRGVRGLGLVTELRERFSDVPVIVMAGSPSDDEIHDIHEVGASYLSKPFQVSNLLREVAGAITNKAH